MFKKGRIPVTNELMPNEVSDQGEFHLSYNRSSADYGCDTTAIVLRGTVFLILKRDHRSALAAACDADGLQGCFDYYLTHIAEAHPFSDHHLILKGDNTFATTEDATKFLGEQNISRLHDVVSALEPTASPVDDQYNPSPGM